jgi:hypothetical protein
MMNKQFGVMNLGINGEVIFDNLESAGHLIIDSSDTPARIGKNKQIAEPG